MVTQRAPLVVGDKIATNRGGYTVYATVIEDRGNIGVGGRQLVRIRVPISGERAVEYEVAADDAQIVRRRRA